MLVYELIKIISKVSLPRFSVKQLVAPLQLIFVVEKNTEVNLSRRVLFVVSLKCLVANNPGAGVVDYYSTELLPMKSFRVELHFLIIKRQSIISKQES